MKHPDLDIAPEIAEALAQGGAVVALESTIIAHGMPYPGNLVTARALEHIIRDQGAAPATIAVLDGRLKVGLDDAALEMLETLSVPVIGYQCDEFPAFYSRTSGLRIPARAGSPEEIAAILSARWRLSDKGGALIANPIPIADEIPAARIEGQIAAALKDASKNGITGKEVTPFLLARIRDLTQGESQKANVALALNNAQLSAQIARAYSTSIKGTR
jgi:pseudouridine-5'-phosphate glycosidase